MSLVYIVAVNHRVAKSTQNFTIITEAFLQICLIRILKPYIFIESHIFLNNKKQFSSYFSDTLPLSLSLSVQIHTAGV